MFDNRKTLCIHEHCKAKEFMEFMKNGVGCLPHMNNIRYKNQLLCLIEKYIEYRSESKSNVYKYLNRYSLEEIVY